MNHGKATCLDIAAAAGLGEGGRRGREFYFTCNQHDDSRPSLRIHPEKKVWKCDPCQRGGTPYSLMAHLAGCDPADKRAVLKWRDAHGLGHNSQNTNGNRGPTTSRIVAEYDDHDETGRLCFQTVRYEPKHFLQRRPDGKGEWIWKLAGVRRVLYRLPELLHAATVYIIVEGEKDVDNLRRLGASQPAILAAEDHLPAGGDSLLGAKPKAGKSTTARGLALAVARGDDFLGCQTSQGTVFYLVLEEKRSEVKLHFAAMGACADDPSFIFCAPSPADGLSHLRAAAEKDNPALINGTLFKFIRMKDGNDYA
jgi:hypothetical protein